MQLSFSAFLPASPEATLPGAPAADAATGEPRVDPSVSFEALLPAGDPPVQPAPEEQDPDAEKTASLLAVSCWMPALTPPPQTMPEPAAIEPVDGEVPVPAEQPAAKRGSFNFSSLGARAYASAVSVPVNTGAFALAGANAGTPEAATPSDAKTVTEPWAAGVSGEAGAVALTGTGVPPSKTSNETVPTEGGTTAQQQQGSGSPAPAGTIASLPVAGTISTSPRLQTPDTAGPAETSTATDPDGVEPLAAEVFSSARQEKLSGPVVSVSKPVPAAAETPLPEKIAAHLRANFPSAPTTDLTPKKDFLSAGNATVIEASLSVGIGVAQRPLAMPSVPFNRSKSVTTVEAVANVSVSANTPPALEFFSELPAPPATVRETMAAVVTAVEALERRADAVQKSVDLQFNVGSERLALRVELRDGTVHTTFRTESPELRTALAHEWQAMVPSAAVGRELRLADPIFSSTPAHAGESASGSTGQGTPQQRGQETPQPAAFSLTPEFSASPAAESTTATPAVPNSTSLLQAFA